MIQTYAECGREETEFSLLLQHNLNVLDGEFNVKGKAIIPEYNHILSLTSRTEGYNTFSGLGAITLVMIGSLFLPLSLC